MILAILYINFNLSFEHCINNSLNSLSKYISSSFVTPIISSHIGICNTFDICANLVNVTFELPLSTLLRYATATSITSANFS